MSYLFQLFVYIARICVNMKTILHTFLIVTFLVSCTARETTRGNFLYAEDIDSIKPTISTQTDVMRTLGTPTAKAVFDEQTWYYVGLKTEKESFFDEKVVEKQVYKIVFDEQNIVKTVALEESENVDVPVSSRVTPTSGNEVTFIQQVLGNIGKFNPPQ